MRLLRHYIPQYSVDIPYLNQLPAEEVAAALGVTLDRQKRCHCPDPNCPDHNSKHPSAHINPHNNTLHCFVCGSTWNNFTLAGLVQFGYDRQQCFTAEAIDQIGSLLGKESGFGGVKELANDRQPENDWMRMPSVEYHDGDALIRMPLYKCFGLAKNPFRSVSVSTAAPDGKQNRTEWETDAVFACRLMFTKGLEALGNACQGLQAARALPADTYRETLLADYNRILFVIREYLPTLCPHMSGQDKDEMLMEAYVQTENEEVKAYLKQYFPKALAPLFAEETEEAEVEYELA